MSRGDAVRAALAAALVVALFLPARAQEPAGADPDWPCVQRKVPTLTPAAIWAGPPLEDVGEWKEDQEVADLVRRLSQRRIPLEEAQAAAEAFAEGLPDDERGERLTMLFAGLFQTMNAERGEIIEGIERYARRQRTLAEEIRKEAAAIEEAGTDQDTADAAEKLRWDQRIFLERRATLPFVCEAPRLVEQRLFALGRTIAQAIN